MNNNKRFAKSLWIDSYTWLIKSCTRVLNSKLRRSQIPCAWRVGVEHSFRHHLYSTRIKYISIVKMMWMTRARIAWDVLRARIAWVFNLKNRYCLLTTADKCQFLLPLFSFAITIRISSLSATSVVDFIFWVTLRFRLTFLRHTGILQYKNGAWR